MSRQKDNNNFLDFIFKTPKKLTFTKLYRFYFDFILRLLYRVFIFENIPESISETFLKLILFTQGKAVFLKAEQIGESGAELVALNFSRADTPDIYYIPRKVLITNPRLRLQYYLTPGDDCEIVYLSEADKYDLSEINGGLYQLISRTAVMLADNDISINISQKNTRLTNLVSGDTQNTVDSIRAVIMAMYEGDPTIVVKSSLIDKLQGIPILNNTSNNQNLVQLIEVQQYILSHFYEQIGICTHDQMKRERLVTAEINDNIDLAFLNIDDILISLQEGLDRVNSMFDTDIQVHMNPIIERQKQEQEAALTMQTEDAAEEQPEEQTEDAAEEQSEDQTEDAAEEQSDEKTEDAAEEQSEEQTEDAAEEQSEDQTEDAAEEQPEDQTEDEAEEQHTEIIIEGDGNEVTTIQGGDDVGSTDKDEYSGMGSDSGDGVRSDDE